jgi:hypothetical protein
MSVDPNGGGQGVSVASRTVIFATGSDAANAIQLGVVKWPHGGSGVGIAAVNPGSGIQVFLFLALFH